jgi:RHS repeat-associated protein
VLTRIQNAALAGNDGIALLPPPPGAVGTSIVVNSNNGVLVEIDNPQTANPTFHNIFTGGSRGDFATVGPDGCLYATQTSSVIKVTASDGSCPFIPSICLPNPVIPQVHVTVNGFTFNYSDSGQALNSGGIDGECNGTNESQAWQQIGGKGGPVNIPLPPAMTLALQAAPSNGHIVGQSQAFTVAAMDGAGRTVPNVAVELGVFGANPQQLSGTTDVNGTATFSYIGSHAGTDTVTATAFISGLRTVSNAVQIQWTIPAPGAPVGGTSGPAPPSVVVTSPADGSAVSQPIPITATIGAPPSSSINFWSAQYQNVAPGSAVITLASGTTKPPATLATFDPTTLAAGTYAITVTATTLAGGGATAVVRVIVGNGGGTAAQAPPTISAPSPADGTIVTKPVPVTATIAPPSGQTIASWKVTYQALDVEPIVTLASGTGTPPSPLTTFDPTLLPNDTYAITIAATASGGGIQTLTTTVAVFGNLKLGRYVTTYLDMSVPVGSFQMQVRRVYDSIDKRVGDFGIGWHVELANFRVSANRQLGAGGWTEYPTSCIFGLCFYGFKTSAPHYVTVTFPDQHQEIFDFTPQGGAGILYWQGSAAFTARAGTGTTSKLEVAGDSSLSYDFAGNLVGASGYFNPTRFKLTTRDGRVLILDTVLGLVSETDTSGNSLTVDANGVRGMLGPASSPTNGPSITFTRDSQGRITDINGPVTGQHYHYAYSTSVALQTVTDPMGNIATYTYDPQSGNLQKSLDPNNQPIQALTYDAAGRLVSIANGSQPPTTITTNLAAQQQVILDPNGKLTTVLFFDALGDVTERDDTFSGRTLKTVNTYDAVGRMTSSTDPVLNQARASYDESGTSADGNLLSYTDAAQRTWSFENYNSFGDPGLIRQPNGTVAETLTYDTTSAALVSSQRPGEPPTTYTYWPSGQQKSVTDPGGRIVKYAYDTSGNLSSIADSQGGTLNFVEDAAGRTISFKDQIGNLTAYSYYPSGLLSTMTDPNRHVWQYFYDARLRLHQTQDPLGVSSFLDYNDLGLLRQRTDRNGQVTTYQYDVDGLMTQETRPGDVVNFRYDPLGRLVAADNSGGHSDRTYDDNGQLASETTCASAGSANATCSAVTSTAQPTVTLSYLYWPDSQLKSAASTDAGSVQYAYDSIGRLGSIQDPTGRSFSFGYDTFGRLTSMSRPNGVNDSFSYTSSSDLAGRDAMFNGSVVARFDYGIDPVTGRRTSMTDTQGTHSFGYFANGTLQSESHPTGSSLPTQAYGFDPAGNRTSWAGVGQASYNAADRLQSDGINNYSFDAEGNLTGRTPVAGGAGTTYDWNADHQLLAIHYPNGTSSSYRYDPFGRRVASQDAAQQTRFVYNGLNVHADYGSQNQLQTSYVTSLDVGSALEAVSSGGQASYYLADGLGTVRALSDSSGAVAGNYQYGAFGQPSSMNPAAGRYTFTGYQYDAASGLYYAGVRYYDPSIGRFLSEDPVPSTNPYPYAVNDPVNFIDLLGMQAAGEYAINTTRNASTIAAVERVAQGLCAAYNKAALAASGASAALNRAPTAVYQSVDEAGKVQYVGITNDVPRRAGEHFRGKGINIDAIPGLNKLSRPMARAVEQVLINRYGALKAGGQLLNAANAVGKANPLLGAALECGQALLGAAGYL